MSAVAMGDDGSDEVIAVWTPGKIIDPSAFNLSDGSERVPITNATVNGTGTTINISYSNALAFVYLEALPGHPALVSQNGMQCGGGFALG